MKRFNSLLKLNLILLICFYCSFITASSLSDAYSAAINELVDNGQYDALHLKWFGTNGTRPFPLCTKYYPITPLGDLKKVLERERVRHGIAILGPPYSFFNGQGQLTGFDAELGIHLTQRVKNFYGLSTLEHVFVISNGIPVILNELNQNKFDIALSDLSIDAARSNVADFTCTYLPVRFGLLRSTLQPQLQWTQLSQLNDPSIKVVTFINSFLQGLVEQFFPLSTKIPALNPPQILSLIANNTGHVAVLPLPFITSYLSGPSACSGCTLLNDLILPVISYRGIATRKQVPCNKFELFSAVRTSNASLLLNPPRVEPGFTFKRTLNYKNTSNCTLTELESYALLKCRFFNDDYNSIFDQFDLTLELEQIQQPSQQDRVLLLNPLVYQQGLVNPSSWKVFQVKGFLEDKVVFRVQGKLQWGKGASNNNIEQGGIYASLSTLGVHLMTLSLDSL